MRPGTLVPSNLSYSRSSGQSSFSIESWNERIRASTDGLLSKWPTLLLSRNGAVDQTLPPRAAGGAALVRADGCGGGGRGGAAGAPAGGPARGPPPPPAGMRYG